MTILIEDLAPDVLAFCERHGLLDAMRRSLKLVQEHFPDARQVSTELVHDPDARDKWVALNVDVPAGLRSSWPATMCSLTAGSRRWTRRKPANWS